MNLLWIVVVSRILSFRYNHLMKLLIIVFDIYLYIECTCLRYIIISFIYLY